MKTYHFSKLQSEILKNYIFKYNLLEFLQQFNQYEWYVNRADQFSIEWDDDNTDDDQAKFNQLMDMIDKYIKMKAFL